MNEGQIFQKWEIILSSDQRRAPAILHFSFIEHDSL